MLAEAIVTRLQQKLGNLATAALRMTPGLGSLAVAQVEGEGDEASRGGIRFHLAPALATGVAPVQALPTTAAQWLLYNPVNSGVNAYFDRLGAWLVSGTAGAGGTLLAAICAKKQAPSAADTLANATGCTPQNGNPGSSKASSLVIASGQTLLNAPAWGPWAFMNPANTVLGQTQMIADDLRGKILIPPGCGLALAVISPTGTTPLFAPLASWREYAGDTE